MNPTCLFEQNIPITEVYANGYACTKTVTFVYTAIYKKKKNGDITLFGFTNKDLTVLTNSRMVFDKHLSTGWYIQHFACTLCRMYKM